MILVQDEVLLRPWQVADARWYVEARDEEVLRWTTERRDLTIGETEDAIQALHARDDVASFAIVDASCNELVGNITAVKGESDAREAEVMYWLAASWRGRGIATKAVRMLCDWAFTEQILERLTLKTYKANVRSQRVAERAGFRPFQPPHEEESEFCWYELTRQMIFDPGR